MEVQVKQEVQVTQEVQVKLEIQVKHEVQVKQEVMDQEESRLPTICDVFCPKREESPTDNVRLDGSYQATHTDVVKCEEMDIKEFNLDKAHFERERAVSSQPVVAGQVKSRSNCRHRTKNMF